MSDLKALALQLVTACEQFHLEKCVYHAVLEGSHVPGWKKRYKELMTDPLMVAQNHEIFAPIFDAIERESDVEEAVRKALGTLPKPQKLD